MTTLIKKSVHLLLRFLEKKDVFSFVIKALIAAGLMWYIVDKVGSVAVMQVLSGADMMIVSLVAGLGVLNIYLQYRKWMVISSAMLGVSKSGVIFRSLMYGITAGSFTPARIGEFVGRKLAYPEHSVLEVTLATAADKLFSFFYILFFGVSFGLLFLVQFYGVSPYLAAALFLVLLFLLLLLVYFLLSEDFWTGFIFKKLSGITFLAAYTKKLEVIKKLDRVTLSFNLLYSFLFYACYLFQFGLLVMALSHSYDLSGFLWAGVLMIFVKTLVPSIALGELGIREAASIYFLSFFQIQGSVAFNAAFLLFVVNILFPAVIGLVLLFRRNSYE